MWTKNITVFVLNRLNYDDAISTAAKLTNSNTLFGLLCMAVAMSLIPVGDAIAKYLSSITQHSSAYLAWTRFVVGGFFALPLAWMNYVPGTLSKDFLKKQFVRGFFISSTLVLIIRAVSLSPIADVFGVFFIGPAFSVVLSVLWLKESATGLEWLSVLLGFIGVLMVVQPGGEMSPGLPWAFAAGLFYGSFLAATRWAAGSGPPLMQLAAQITVGLIILFPLAAKDLPLIEASSLPVVIAMGVTSTFANLLSIIALNRARAAFLAPIVYLQVVVATLIGLFFFQDSLNLLAAAGIALIIFTGLLKIRLPGRLPRR